MRTLLRSMSFWIRLLFQPTLGVPFPQLVMLGKRYYRSGKSEFFDQSWRAFRLQLTGTRLALAAIFGFLITQTGLHAAVALDPSLLATASINPTHPLAVWVGFAFTGLGASTVFGIFQVYAHRTRSGTFDWSGFMRQVDELRRVCPDVFKMFARGWHESPEVAEQARKDMERREQNLTESLSSDVCCGRREMLRTRATLERIKQVSEVFHFASFRTIEVTFRKEVQESAHPRIESPLPRIEG